MDGLTWTLGTLGYVLAVMRITRLINSDVATDWLRIAAARRWGATSTPAYFLSCAWCVSTWVATALGAVLIAATGISWWWLLVAAPAASHLTGLLSALDPDDVQIVDD